MTKGGVYLLDQKRTLYSVGRHTKRWPLRKDFLKALSLELVTEYHHTRSTTKSFSKPLRSIVRKHAGQSPETMEEDIPESLSKAQKRCHLCCYKKDRKTKTLSQKCQKKFCKEHFIIMCRQCIEIFRKLYLKFNKIDLPEATFSPGSTEPEDRDPLPVIKSPDLWWMTWPHQHQASLRWTQTPLPVGRATCPMVADLTTSQSKMDPDAPSL
ncbi:hypothetical protein LAZ67_11003684 [Cordylochernes scorpioides]|uniref:Uncharacterized protein n=1 Tax=Cordylochernes scorpioides TaxID=51811 RepID=A0ABY6L402_9ARAC|nr:hypothetical protein LAZ67_11003684 [Cordylochernes scorpioides]